MHGQNSNTLGHGGWAGSIDTMAAAAGGTTASVVSDAESEETVAQGVCSDRETLDEVRECTRPGSAIAIGHAADRPQ